MDGRSASTTHRTIDRPLQPAVKATKGIRKEEEVEIPVLLVEVGTARRAARAEVNRIHLATVVEAIPNSMVTSSFHQEDKAISIDTRTKTRSKDTDKGGAEVLRMDSNAVAPTDISELSRSFVGNCLGKMARNEVCNTAR